jgi:hypothetical protein
MDKRVKAPQDYEELIRVIHDRYDEMSKSYQKIALYLTQNPSDVAVRSVNSIGESCGVHASSFVRFAGARLRWLQGSAEPISEAPFDCRARVRSPRQGAGERS